MFIVLKNISSTKVLHPASCMMHYAWCMMVEDDLQLKTTFGGRWPSVEDDLRWKTSFGGRRPLVEDNIWWKKNFGGRQPSVEDDIRWILACFLLRFAAFFKDGDCPRNGDHPRDGCHPRDNYFPWKGHYPIKVTILRMITILVMVTIKRDGDHHKGWFIFKCDLFIWSSLFICPADVHLPEELNITHYELEKLGEHDDLEN